MKSLSIVIPCLNSFSTLSQTIESIISASHLKGVPVYLLDGGSRDCTLDIVSHFRKVRASRCIELIEFPGVHPAERVNRFIDLKLSDYAFVCHSDDVYIPSAMERMTKDLEKSECYAMGAQCLYFEDPVDAAKRGEAPYSGKHFSHPLSPVDIRCEMALWWCISWNTILLDISRIADAGLRIDHQFYPFCNDYDFNSRLSGMLKICNAPYASVLTRHRASGDGPVHREHLSDESTRIRKMHRERIGLSDFLGPRLLAILDSVSYQYSNWSFSDSSEYALADYLELASNLGDFSSRSSINKHFGAIARSLRNAASSILSGRC